MLGELINIILQRRSISEDTRAIPTAVTAVDWVTLTVLAPAYKTDLLVGIALPVGAN